MSLTEAIDSIGSSVRGLAKAIQEKAGSETKEVFLGKGTLLYLAIYSYFTGFVYLFYYYKRFDVPITASEIPAYYFFVYSYNVAIRFWWVIGPALLLAAVGIGLSKTTRFARPLALIILVLLFPLLSWMAARTAESESIRTRQGSTSNIVKFVFKPDVKDAYPSVLLEANETEGLLLLSETSDRIYALYQPTEENGELPNATVFRVNKDDLIVEMTITPGIRAQK